MSTMPSEFEHYAESLNEIKHLLQSMGVDLALLKVLPKNANDKNQVYWSSDFGSLHRNFDLTIADRGQSTSLTKDRSAPGSAIPEAVFNKFSWVKNDGLLVRAKNVKAVVYTQYPEARLSGFLTVENSMPGSLSVAYMKANPDCKRLLILGRLPGGACVAIIYLGLPEQLASEISSLPSLEGSRVCKVLKIAERSGDKLFPQLSTIVSRPLPGCRLDAFGNTLPFTGTQVCGYTLERELGISPNSDMAGDIYGIELKTHTKPKVTLFTPEPDFGLYAEGFNEFMQKYGYESDGEIRVTGVHRAGLRCAKSGLTLKVREYRVGPTINKDEKPDWIRDENGNPKPFPYDNATSLTSKMGAVEVVLQDDSGFVAAGWSLERLMNNWGVKHNKVVYITASKTENSNATERDAGFRYSITFSPKVIWCQETSAERLLAAINNGVVFLDPAPKLVPHDPSKNKRRAQWRVNDITQAVKVLYESVEYRDLS